MGNMTRKQRLESKLRNVRRKLNEQGFMHKPEGALELTSNFNDMMPFVVAYGDVIIHEYPECRSVEDALGGADIFDAMSEEGLDDEQTIGWILDRVEDDEREDEEEAEIDESVKLTEGTANFYGDGGADWLPLLVFMSYDSVYDAVRDAAEDEYIGQEDEDDYDEKIESFIDEYFDEYSEGVCVLDDFVIDELENDLHLFNQEIQALGDELAYGEGSEDDAQFDRGQVLKNIEVRVEPGYYEGAQIFVGGKDARERGWSGAIGRDEELLAEEDKEKISNFLNEIKKKYGLTELSVSYRASNGETGYKIVDDEEEKVELPSDYSKEESLKEGKKVKQMSKDELEAEFKKVKDEIAKAKEKNPNSNHIRDLQRRLDDITKAHSKYGKFDKSAKESIKEGHEDDLVERIAEVLDDYGILYGDIVDGKYEVSIVGVDESEWEEAADAIATALGLDVSVPEEGHDEFDDELIVTKESLKEDTVKQGSHWVNKGKEGTHGKFKTKKEADAQRKAMFARGYKEDVQKERHMSDGPLQFENLVNESAEEEIRAILKPRITGDNQIRAFADGEKLPRGFRFLSSTAGANQHGYVRYNGNRYWFEVKDGDVEVVREAVDNPYAKQRKLRKEKGVHVNLNAGDPKKNMDAFNHAMGECSVTEDVESERSGLANEFGDNVKDEWDAIDGYNTLETEILGSSLTEEEKEKLLAIIHDIRDEEYRHVGQLQQGIKTVAPDAKNIEAGTEEAKSQEDMHREVDHEQKPEEEHDEIEVEVEDEEEAK